MVTEASTQTATGTQTGNSITSEYSLSQAVTNSYTMTETGSDFTLSETGSWTGASDNSGNTIEGNYTYTTTGSDTYHLGKHSTHYKQRLSAVTHESSGLYSVRNIVAEVIYNERNRHNRSQRAFSEVIFGNESFTSIEIGNPVAQTYDRTITASGTFTAPGPEVVTPPSSGSYSYETMETADAKSGVLNQTQPAPPATASSNATSTSPTPAAATRPAI